MLSEKELERKYAYNINNKQKNQTNNNKELKKNLSHKNYFLNKELSINKYSNDNLNKSIDEESSEMSIGNNHYKKKMFKKINFQIMK